MGGEAQRTEPICRTPDALFETQPKENPPGLIPTGPLTRYLFREGPI